MRRNDSGHILLITIGLAVVVIALVFVVVSVSALHLERLRLQAAADTIAHDAATALDEAAYYAGGTATVWLTDHGVRQAAAAFLADYGDRLGVAQARITAPTGTPDGRTAQVTLTVRADVILIPALLSVPSAVDLTATASARAG